MPRFFRFFLLCLSYQSSFLYFFLPILHRAYNFLGFLNCNRFLCLTWLCQGFSRFYESGFLAVLEKVKSQKIGSWRKRRCLMLPPRVGGGIAQSSSSSGISFQGDGHSQVAGNLQMSSKIENSPIGNVCQETIFNSMACSGPSAGASSFVSDANSGLSIGPHLHRSCSYNTESYMRLPASPLSFSSNNISLSNSSIIDVSSVVQQNSYQDHRAQQLLGNSNATSMLHMGQAQLASGGRLPNSYIQEAIALSQLQKKPRLDIKQEDILPQHLPNRQDPVLLHSSSPQFQGLIQQYQLRQQEQQIMQSQLLQHQQLLRLQGEPHPYVSAVKHPYDGGVCSRGLMQYLYHEKQRPAENSIAYWRRFVSEYYSQRATKRWCGSMYNTVGQHSLN